MTTQLHQAKAFLSKLVYNKFFWQLILAVFMLSMTIFFIHNEHIELVNIKEKLSESNPYYVALGIFLTVCYVIFQGQMYVHSFKALGITISLRTSLVLFLRRNLISVFLPAGGFASLAFFTGEVEKHGATKSQIHLASTIFGFISILSVVVIAFPILGYALIAHNLQNTELLGFLFLILLTGAFIALIFSVSKKGMAYQWIVRARPSLGIILDEMIDHAIDRRQLGFTLLVSLCIEVLGIAHLYIAMLALGFEPSWVAAAIGYIVMVILLSASPFLRGLGAIEVSVTFILGQFGYPVITAATITPSEPSMSESTSK